MSIKYRALTLTGLGMMCFGLGATAQHQLEEPRAQILLVYDHKATNGQYVVSAKAQAILALKQADPEKHLAPVERGTLMLCRPYSEGVHLMFRCGQDVFVMDAIDLQPEK